MVMPIGNAVSHSWCTKSLAEGRASDLRVPYLFSLHQAGQKANSRPLDQPSRSRGGLYFVKATGFALSLLTERTQRVISNADLPMMNVCFLGHRPANASD